MNLNRISLFFDVTTVNCLNFNLYADLILNCKMLMNQLELVNVNHVNRQLNVVAHELVGLSQSVDTKT